MTKKSNKSMEGISRIDAERAQGWYLRIYYPDKGQLYAKFFSDGVHGGKRKAQKAAQAHKEEYIRQNPPPPKLPFARKATKSNTSGVNGVSETYARSRNGSKIPCFSVSWAPQPNVHKVKKFYHHHYPSRAEAFKAATEFRREKELERLRRWAKQQGQPLEVYLEALDR